MAGNYPDVPGFRFQYDRDGSIMSIAGATASVSTMRLANDENSGGKYCDTLGDVAVAWPEVRTVTGMFTIAEHGVSYGDYGTLYTSVDTTNGVDGTWVNVGSLFENVTAAVGYLPVPDMCRRMADANGKSGIIPYPGPCGPALTNIRGVKLSPVYHGGYSPYCWHIYGNWPTTQNPDRLILCDGGGAVVTNGAYFDFGDAARSTQATIPFRIRNNSAVSTANSVNVSFECLFDGTPSLLTQFDFSTNGGASYVTSQNIGNLGPGAITPTYLLRRNTLAGAATGPWQLRLLAVPALMT